MKTAFRIFIVVFVTAAFVRTFFFDSFIVSGDSMAPAVSGGDYIFINKLAYRSDEPRRGDIVVAKITEGNAKRTIIKRVIGLPGERVNIENDHIYITQQRKDQGLELIEQYLAFPQMQKIGISEIMLDPYEYFVLGDNRWVSIDSREFGPVDGWDIEGRVFLNFRLKNLKLIRL